jgi:flagellar protein FlgJ
MNIAAANSGLGTVDSGRLAGKANALLDGQPDRPELQEAFSDFVGQTFFGQLIAAMRKTVDKPAYFHGGRAEEVFQGQLDQMLTERLSDSSREQFAEPMYELFMMQRPG